VRGRAERPVECSRSENTSLFEAIALLSRELDADANLVPSEAARPAVLEWAISEAEVLHC
jgi:hypothetical protein